MNSFILFLRGINVGGKNKILMKDLKELLSSLGFFNVQTYLQSGNVVFQHDEQDVLSWEIGVKEAISDKFGLNVPVLILKSEDLKRSVDSNPYQGEEIEKLYYVFLSETPSQDKIGDLKSIDFKKDELDVKGKTLYIKVDTKISQSKITQNLIEKKLGENATMRNHKTVVKMMELGNSE